MTAPRSDNELIFLYKKTRDLSLIGELYRRYAALTYGVCLKYLKDRDEAKDASMQLFEKLIDTLRTHDVENFRSWLYVTARNHCLMQIRSKKGKFREEIDALDMENQFLLHPEEGNDVEGDLDKLEDCIKKLADGQKECIRLFYLSEKCYKEITAVTGFDLNQVKSFIQNGKRNLKICMEQYE
ncbi:MAG TPA: sigma-70 family RNA polymerase sigma factor [Cyclobacteriaceae bacterium]|nr:sigma-70 family RNA polymerase sigma factor [Cyclobacteriaceae bacterium]